MKNTTEKVQVTTSFPAFLGFFIYLFLAISCASVVALIGFEEKILPKLTAPTDTLTLPCLEGQVVSGFETPAGDSLFTVLCPQGEDDGDD